MIMLVKRVAALLLAAVLAVGCGMLLNYALVDDTQSHTRVQMFEFYHTGRNIDIAYVGSSHVKYTFSPDVIDAETGEYSFNLGSGSQGLDDSLAMIRELCATNHPKQIILELFASMAFRDYDDYDSVTRTMIVLDYLRPTQRKLRYLFTALPREQYVNGLIPARRVWEKLFDIRYIADLLKKKQTDAYRNHRFDAEGQGKIGYGGRGYFVNKRTWKPKSLWNGHPFWDRKHFTREGNPHALALLKEIIDFCRERGVKLTFVVAPVPEGSAVGLGDYQKYIDMIQEIADQNGLEYYDFNLCRPEYFDASQNDLYADFEHLNVEGSQQVSRLLGQLLAGKLSPQALFYDTMADKLADEEPRLLGLTKIKNGNKEGVRYGYILSNRTEGLEYRITAAPKKGKEREVKPWSQEKAFELPQEEKGKLTIYWRLEGRPETEKSAVTRY